MKSGKVRLPWLSRLLLLLLLSGVAMPADAGNQGIIEDRVEELDDLNRQVVEQTGPLPADGVIELKAQVFQQGESVNAEIIEKRVITKDQAMDFNAGHAVTQPEPTPPEKERPDEKRTN